MESIEEESEAAGPSCVVPESLLEQVVTDKGTRGVGLLRRLGLKSAGELWWYCVASGFVVKER